MYAFVTGPLAWLAFSIFFVGCAVRAVVYVRGLNWQLDRVAYTQYPRFAARGALRSIFFWLLPYGTQSWRRHKGFTLLVFVFHLGLILTPILVLGHNVLLLERWGFSFWTLPERVSDAMTTAVIVTAVFIVLRRIALTEVRILSTPYDYLVLAIAVAPFATGFMAYHHFGDYRFWLIVHILCGEIMLAAIPFTKLSHFVLFFMSRAQLGIDYGVKRGGMKSKGLAW